MWNAEQCRGWVVVGRDLALALLLFAGVAIPGSLWLVRRVQPGPRWLCPTMGLESHKRTGRVSSNASCGWRQAAIRLERGWA